MVEKVELSVLRWASFALGSLLLMILFSLVPFNGGTITRQILAVTIPGSIGVALMIWPVASAHYRLKFAVDLVSYLPVYLALLSIAFLLDQKIAEESGAVAPSLKSSQENMMIFAPYILAVCIGFGLAKRFEDLRQAGLKECQPTS